ncbi:MAG: hypothetical protein J1E34_03630 [Oscillospiraceae bacterium]|nr:hypothetical protein [Oscillospiraceae bacterium]
MKAKIIILGKVRTEAEGSDTFEEILKKTFDPVLMQENGIEYFSTLKEATAAIGKAFSDSDTIMFFSVLSKYAETKEILCKALGLQLTVDERLLAGALKTASEKEQESLDFNVCHAGVVSGGDIFALSDCLYSGFAAKRGRQTVMLLPLEESRAYAVLGNFVIPYMNEKLSSSLSAAPLQYYYAEKLSAASAREKVKIAIAGTKPAVVFKKYVASSEGLSDRILLVNKTENRGSMPPNEYVVNLSITAAELMGVPYGIAMSNAYYSGDDANGVKTVYIAVTNEVETTVREISSFYGESTGEFIFRCCSEQCKLLTEIIDADAGLIKKESPVIDKQKSGDKYKALIAVLVAVILFVCAAGGYYFRAHSYSLKNWAQSYLPFLYSEQEETKSSEQTFPSGTSNERTSDNSERSDADESN